MTTLASSCGSTGLVVAIAHHRSRRAAGACGGSALVECLIQSSAQWVFRLLLDPWLLGDYKRMHDMEVVDRRNHI